MIGKPKTEEGWDEYFMNTYSMIFKGTARDDAKKDWRPKNIAMARACTKKFNELGLVKPSFMIRKIKT